MDQNSHAAAANGARARGGNAKVRKSSRNKAISPNTKAASPKKAPQTVMPPAPNSINMSC